MRRTSWSEFETAVAQFIAALDPTATVRHNVRVPDKHTHRPRQRDVWIETKLFRHYPVKVLVSCKQWKRKANEQDIDAFYGELESSGAHLGVLYSYSGFTAPAIEKATELEISCCTLYSNQAPDLPGFLMFDSFCLVPKVRIRLPRPPESTWNLQTFEDLFNLDIGTPGNPLRVLDRLAGICYEAEAEALQDYKTTLCGPKDWAAQLQIWDAERKLGCIEIEVDGIWIAYHGKLEAHLLNGSYNFTTKEFSGSQAGPFVDMRGPAPGSDWELLPNRPETYKARTVVYILYHGDVAEALLSTLGSRRLMDVVQ